MKNDKTMVGREVEEPSGISGRDGSAVCSVFCFFDSGRQLARCAGGLFSRRKKITRVSCANPVACEKKNVPCSIPSPPPNQPPPSPNCVETESDLIDRLEVIKQTVDQSGIIQLCTTTLLDPLILAQNVTLSGDDFNSVTIGCEGQNSMSVGSPACGISRSSSTGFFEIGNISGGSGSVLSFQFENIVVNATVAPDIPFIEARISNSMLSIINSEFTSQQGTRALVDVAVGGNTMLDIARSTFSSGDLQVDNLASEGSTGGSITIDKSTFTGNIDG